MLELKTLTNAVPTLIMATLTMGSIVVSAVTYGDDAPPAQGTDPGADGGRHRNPAWAACKKQADDQKMVPGDARREFMKHCVKSANDSAAAPAKP